jgi:hypothetical protein
VILSRRICSYGEVGYVVTAMAIHEHIDSRSSPGYSDAANLPYWEYIFSQSRSMKEGV